MQPNPAPRAAILTIDDDPSVSRAVARDLRRKYGDQHRIVRAESGDQALDALREMKLRGEDVAILLADYRMPRMSGLEFLEHVGSRLNVVMLTTEGQPELMARAKALGARGWIMKPFKPELVIATARKLVAA